MQKYIQVGLAVLLLCGISLEAREIVSIYAIDRQSGKVLVDELGDIGMTPASCLKVLTTGAALHLLGEEYRFTTTLEYDGELKDHVLYGNLYIRGGGDPCLGAGDWQMQLKTWIQAIRDRGIREIKGRVVGDATAWESAMVPSGWSWEDLGNYYGAGACALSFHENCYTLTLQPSQVDGKVTVLSENPPQFDLDLHNELRTGPVSSGDRACIYGSEFSSMRFVRGTIPAGVDAFAIQGAILDPPRYLEKIFTDAIRKTGIEVLGEKFSGTDRIAFHTTRSPTVAQIVQETNQQSMNLYAEHLLKAMGQGSTKKGLEAVRAFWESMGIDLADAQITDGSGLSRNNVLTAKQCVAVLRKMESSPHFNTLFSSLPELHGMKVKSGSMSLVKGYVGYSQKCLFAFFIGQCPDSKKKQALEDACFAKIIGL